MTIHVHPTLEQLSESLSPEGRFQPVARRQVPEGVMADQTAHRPPIHQPRVRENPLSIRAYQGVAIGQHTKPVTIETPPWEATDGTKATDKS